MVVQRSLEMMNTCSMLLHLSEVFPPGISSSVVPPQAPYFPCSGRFKVVPLLVGGGQRNVEKRMKHQTNNADVCLPAPYYCHSSSHKVFLENIQ